MLDACTGAGDPQQEWRRWREQSEREKVPAVLFPEATIVKAYAGPVGITVTGAGTVYAAALENGAVNTLAMPIGGDQLSAQEIAVVSFYAHRIPRMLFRH